MKRKNPAAVALARLNKNPGRKPILGACRYGCGFQSGVRDMRAHEPKCPMRQAKPTDMPAPAGGRE